VYRGNRPTETSDATAISPSTGGSGASGASGVSGDNFSFFSS
jgi:hypothetical protein